MIEETIELNKQGKIMEDMEKDGQNKTKGEMDIIFLHVNLFEAARSMFKS